jgi:hypothetical protein
MSARSPRHDQNHDEEAEAGREDDGDDSGIAELCEDRVHEATLASRAPRGGCHVYRGEERLVVVDYKTAAYSRLFGSGGAARTGGKDLAEICHVS